MVKPAPHDGAPKPRVAILISGRGSNMAALIKAANADDFPAEIAVVISNRADAMGLALAGAEGIPTVTIESKPFGKDRAAFEAALQSALEAYRIELICLGGFMRLFTAEFVQAWYGKMLNIHPSLLPAFPGLHAQRQALDYGAQVVGCSVHFVDESVDGGILIVQRAMDVLPNDTEATLSERLLAEEHLAYVEGIRRVLSGEYEVAGRRFVPRATGLGLSAKAG
jgi:phosphoribosylglycinamide formyltransferase-1